MSQPASVDDRVAHFVTTLQALHSEGDRATLAVLRRGMGKPPGTAPEMHRFVVPLLDPDAPPARDESYYLVASLFAWHPCSATDGSFGASMRALRSGTATGGAERHMNALLAADRDGLPEHLRHCVSLLKANDIGVDWAALLRHLTAWETPCGWVQRLWAQAFWRPDRPPVEGAAAATSEPVMPM